MRGLNSFLLVGALTATGIAPGELPAQSPSPLRMRRLPAVRPVPESDNLQTEEEDFLQFAAGAVELRPPDGWWVEETPHGREVRLVMTPDPPVASRRMPLDGIWITFHVSTQHDDRPRDELGQMLPNRIRLATSNRATSSQLTSFSLGLWPAAAAEFTVASEPGDSARPTIHGRHVLVRTDWGIFELHASVPVAQLDQRAKAWAKLWDTIKLQQPVTSRSTPDPAVGDAATVIGSWKSYRSRMRLGRNGRITIVPDSVNLLTEPDSNKVLGGAFEANADILYVTWDDGSRLNFRWRLQDDELLLTDHDGRISRLKRLLE